MTTVVAVADALGRQARLVDQVRAACAAVGHQVVARTHAELVAEVSVEQGPDGRVLVEPDRPLLWLSPGDAGLGDSTDDRFLASELATASRSIAMLTTAPVLNRPTADAACGTLPGRAALIARRARDVAGIVVRAEWFASDAPPVDGPGDEGEEVFDYGRLLSSFGTPPDALGPFRRRPGVAHAQPVAVTVVGDRVVGGRSARAVVEEPSRRLAGAFSLDLATVWWLVPREHEPTLARIDGWSYDLALHAAGIPVADVASAAAAWIVERVGPSEPAPT